MKTIDETINFSDPAELRRAIRQGRFRGFTNGVARGHVQGNLMIVPAAHAEAFEGYCLANAQALPILGRSEPGSPRIPTLGEDLDLRTDVGGYMVFRDGELVDTPDQVSNVWRDDLVAFVLGCSFSFESILQSHGVRLRHLDEGSVSAMYVTDRDTTPVGPFGGKMVVSMRALSTADAIAATLISAYGRDRCAAASGVSDMTLDDLYQRYEEEGYVILPDFLEPEEVAALRGVTDRLEASAAGLSEETPVYDFETNEEGKVAIQRIKKPHRADPLYLAMPSIRGS